MNDEVIEVLTEEEINQNQLVDAKYKIAPLHGKFDDQLEATYKIAALTGKFDDVATASYRIKPLIIEGIDDANLTAKYRIMKIGNASLKGFIIPRIGADMQAVMDVVSPYEGIDAEFRPTPPAPAMVLYVDANNGDDENGDGSAIRPFKTLKKAIEMSTNNTTIHIREGVYELEPFRINSSTSVGVWDMGNKLTIVGCNERTILRYDGVLGSTRDSNAIRLTHSESTISNLIFQYIPAKVNNYSNALFNHSNGKIHNILFENISENINWSYIYGDNRSTIPRIENCIFKSNGLSSNDYSGNPVYINCIFDKRPSRGTISYSTIRNIEETDWNTSLPLTEDIVHRGDVSLSNPDGTISNIGVRGGRHSWGLWDKTAFSLRGYIRVPEISEIGGVIRIRPRGFMEGEIEATPPPLITQVLEPVKDAYIRDKELPSLNYGDLSTAVTGYSEEKDEKYRIFIGFDIDEVPKNNHIIDAKLRVYLTPGFSPQDLIIREVLEEWEEMKITWIYQPAIDMEGDIVGEFTTDSSGGYFEIDITPTFLDWYNGIKKHEGITIVPANEYENMIQSMSTREGFSPPQIIVRYYETAIHSYGIADLKSAIVVVANNSHELRGKIEVPRFDLESDLPAVIDFTYNRKATVTVSRDTLGGKISVAVNDHNDLKSKLAVKVDSASELPGRIVATRDSVVSKVTVRRWDEKDIDGKITVQRWDESHLDGRITISRPYMGGKITVRISDDLQGKIGVKLPGHSDLSAILKVTASERPAKITVQRWDSSDLSGKLQVKTFWEKDLDATFYLNSPYKKARIFVAGRSDIQGRVHVKIPYADDLRSKIKINLIDEGGSCCVTPDQLEYILSQRSEEDIELISIYSGRSVSPDRYVVIEWLFAQELLRIVDRNGTESFTPFCAIETIWFKSKKD